MNRYIRPVTPAEISMGLNALCSELVPGGKPVYVPVRPNEGAPADECFHIVDATASRSGGKAVLGWSLWELPGAFIEAELHAVWRSPDGEFIDVTPKKHPICRVLFLANMDLVYSGRQVNNVRVALSRDPSVTQYLATFDDEFELLNRGARAKQHGEIELGESEGKEFASILSRRASLLPQVLSCTAFVGPYGPCPCNSGVKVKWCHGKGAFAYGQAALAQDI